MPNDAKPVAWMYSHPDDPLPPSVRTERHDKYDFAAMAKRGWTETPLYAHPPAPAQPELVERVARAIYDEQHRGAKSCYAWDDAWEPYQEARRDQYYRDARAALAAMPVGGDTGTLLDLDHARLALFNAIRAIEIGNPTDDKLILENLRKAGVWLCTIGSIESTIAKVTRDSLTPPADADAGLVAKIIHDTLENDDDSDGGGYMRAANAVLAALGQGGVR